MPDVVRAARLRTAYKGVEYLVVRRRLPSRLAGLAVLDVGSGICQQAALMSEPAGLVIGADSNEEALRFGSMSYYRAGGAAPLACDARSLPLADASVDIITSFGVLEHLDDPHGVLRSLHRVLKPGGQVVLTADCLRDAAETGFPLASFREAFDVKTLYDVDTLYRAMTGAGFEVVDIGYVVSSRRALAELRRYLAGSDEASTAVKAARVGLTLLAERRLRSPRSGQFVLVDAIRPAAG
jgi:ubiquinone/menaquinone biosynthesis C-methylase UbiE